METEVKLRLQDTKAHHSLTTLLTPYLKRTHFLHNIFCDGAASELSSRNAVLLFRIYGEDPAAPYRCVVILKSKAALVDGISRVEMDVEVLDPSVGQALWANPNHVGNIVESRVLRRVREEFGVNIGDGFVCLGLFKNVRRVYVWNRLTLDVDETLFEFGTLYEVECESCEPNKAKGLIEGFLKMNGIPYSYSKMTKFAIFQAGLLPNS